MKKLSPTKKANSQEKRRILQQNYKPKTETKNEKELRLRENKRKFLNTLVYDDAEPKGKVRISKVKRVDW